MSEMIERVARAICSKRCVLGARFGQPCVDQTGRNAPCRATEIDLRYTAGVWDAARAAIAAMREPTAEMTTAGVDAEIPGGQWGTPEFQESTVDEKDVPVIWRAMIDRALAD